MYCYKCGAQIAETSAFCAKCGAKQNNAQLPNQNTAFVPAKCTNCGGILKVDSSKEAAICPFCNQPYIVSKAINNIHLNGVTNIGVANIRIDGAPTIDNLRQRARNFERNGDVDSAVTYYNRLLDMSPNDSDAINAIYRLNNCSYKTAPCVHMSRSGEIYLMRDKLLFIRKKKKLVLPYNDIVKVYFAPLNKRSVCVDLRIEPTALDRLANTGRTVKMYPFIFNSKEIAADWERAIIRAYDGGKYPSQIE